MKKPKIKQNTKVILKNVIVGLAIAGATWGTLRLVGVASGKNDKNLKQLVKVNLDKDFFKEAKEGTETISSITYQTFTLDIKKDRKTTYEFKLVVYAGASKDFSEALTLDAAGTGAYVQVTNLNAALCEVAGIDNTAKKNEVIDSYLPVFTDATNSTDAFSKVTLSAANSVYEFSSISFYGLAKDQPKA